MRQVYMDYAATTPLHPDIEELMRPFAREFFGNPSSTHAFGRKAREAVERAREQVAFACGCSPADVIFTSGGTEADNAAIIGTAIAVQDKGRHIVTTAMEHHAVLNTCEFLEQLDYEVTYVMPNKEGIISAEDFLSAIRVDTVVASCMWVNNETGAVQPIEAISEGCRELGVPFHTDAVQAAGLLPIAVKDQHISLLSLSGHKLYGPKGVGALIVSQPARFKPFLHGGSQERGRRGGTENVAAIVGLGAAIARAVEIRARIIDHLTHIRSEFLTQIQQLLPDQVILHSPKDSVPSILSLGFPGVKNETLLMNLDLRGVAASSGSACTAGSLQPSHVLLAMGLPLEEVRSTLRFSFSEQTTLEEVHYVASEVAAIVGRVRKP
ncbi:MAG: Cysteine desulfurase [Bacilli bacterium]|nr:Cysteine desulfurase [Bacilli bacterium]